MIIYRIVEVYLYLRTAEVQPHLPKATGKDRIMHALAAHFPVQVYCWSRDTYAMHGDMSVGWWTNTAPSWSAGNEL